ncbi:hypothetical protein [Arthrobacter sp. zg-Y1143]|uniref:hypothetical protein n=1 Tax=Arthrobacter sp. zg-Y1143 TaxID=3049065 RepID=UPI0024C43BFC|nr:hypothetical protein [Arthrobacter sp. zg-Y1143]MDK1328056.1 hypothetical protein [Arthrobacter sp. zg-Y1143]
MGTVPARAATRDAPAGHPGHPGKAGKEHSRAGRNHTQQRRSPELLGWGLFLTLIGAAAMVWVEVPPSAVAVTSSLLLFAFGVAWCFSPAPASPAAVAGSSVPALAPAPAPAADSVPAPPAVSVQAPVPIPATRAATPASRPTAAAPTRPALRPSPAQQPSALQPSPALRPAPQPARMDRPAPHGRRAAAMPVVHEMPAEPSRWTRTFGPPETGQIPLQPYLARTPAPLVTADAELPDRRQRSHSSL